MRSALTGIVFFLLAAGLSYASLYYGLGRLPGDIVIDRGGYYFYAPFTTAILVCLLLSLIFWLVGRR